MIYNSHILAIDKLMFKFLLLYLNEEKKES